MIRKSLAVFGIAIVVVLVVACSPAAEPAPVGMANPASTYCADQDYKLEIRKDASGGEAGYCVFPDGTECDEWAFFRGECGQDKSFCANNGGKIETGDNGATCVFPDGSSCPESDFFTGKCKPGGS